MAFAADLRNIGGRMQIVEDMKGHYRRLNSTKPTISMKLNKPKRRRATHDPYKNFLDNAEVYFTFKRVKETPASTDASEPRTFGLAKKMSRRKVMRNRNNYDVHGANVSNMLRRMGEIGSMQYRKKNLHDPLAYPVIFFRRDNEGNPNTNITHFAN
jgi:hypothetical protein